ncbi:MAG: hypothetical protein ACQEQO_07160 [Thermodesulfobacteriota bacterium]
MKRSRKDFLENFSGLYSKLKPALEDYLLAVDNASLSSLVIDNIVDRPFSMVVFFHALTTSGMKKYVLKKVSHHEVNRTLIEKENQAVVEFNILSQLYPYYSSIPGCAVPKPVLVFPEEEAFLMEFVSGNLLMDCFCYTRMFSSLKGYKKLLKDVELCGKWLSHFHGNDKRSVQGKDVCQMVIERAFQRVEFIEEANDPRIPSWFRERVEHFFDRQLAEIKVENVIVASRHSDFTPLNVISSEDGVTVIDFFGYCEDIVCVDVMKWLVFLEDEMLSLTSSRKRVNALRVAFTDGYGKLPEVSGTVMLLCEGLQRIVSIWAQLSHRQKFFHHKLESSVRIKGHTEWFAADQKRSLWPS